MSTDSTERQGDATPPHHFSSFSWYNPKTKLPDPGKKLLCFSNGVFWFGDRHAVDGWRFEIVGKMTSFAEPFLWAYLGDLSPWDAAEES